MAMPAPARRSRAPTLACTAALAALAGSLLAGCGGCPADSTAVLGPTREPLAQGTRVFSHKGVAHLEFDQAIVRLKELDRSKTARYCGQRLAAAEGVDDAAIVADVGRQLGNGWLPAEKIALSADMRIYRWQSQCSARFYALAVHGQLRQGGDAPPLRPMVSMYPCGG